MKKGELKSSTRGRTKARRTKLSKAQKSFGRKTPVSVGSRRYALPARLASKLEEQLRPHLITEETSLSFEEFFEQAEGGVPEWGKSAARAAIPGKSNAIGIRRNDRNYTIEPVSYGKRQAPDR